MLAVTEPSLVDVALSNERYVIIDAVLTAAVTGTVAAAVSDAVSAIVLWWLLC